MVDSRMQNLGVTFVLTYIGYNIFNIERYSGAVYIPDRQAARMTGESFQSYSYEDGVCLKVRSVREHDEYLHLYIYVMGGVGADKGVALQVITECPVVVSFSYSADYQEVLGWEGDCTEELRASERYTFVFCDGEYIR